LLKTLENFDFSYAAALNKRDFMQIVDGEYIEQHRNVIFLGRSGTGRTHLATSRGIEACKAGKKVRFVTACRLVNELSEPKKDGELQRILKRYSKYDLLIVDELGYVPISRNGSQLLFQVFADRHELKSVIVASNLGFADWTQIFDDHNLTAALLDRLTCRAHIFSCTWESYRLASSLNRKK
jgi:DNA replication protein DnaC